MKLWPAALLLCLLGQACSVPVPATVPTADQSASPPTSAMPTSSAPKPQPTPFDLHAHTWRDRLLLVFAPAPDTAAYQQQMQQFQGQQAGLRERDLKVVSVLASGQSRAEKQPIDSASAQRLRQQFDIAPDEFAVILIGKDGTEKRRDQAPVEATAIFNEIDAMPMRQQEMRHSH